jgi:hypothetical protein
MVQLSVAAWRGLVLTSRARLRKSQPPFPARFPVTLDRTDLLVEFNPSHTTHLSFTLPLCVTDKKKYKNLHAATLSDPDRTALVRLFQLFDVENRPVFLPGPDQVNPGGSLKSGPSPFQIYDGPFPFWAGSTAFHSGPYPNRTIIPGPI